MDESTYIKIKNQLLEVCKDDIVRIFDEAFLKRQKEELGGKKRGELIAEAFALPAIVSWILWYLFQEMASHNLFLIAVLDIFICATFHYGFSIKHHKEWVRDTFSEKDTRETTKKCLLECEKIMIEQAKTKYEAEQISAFFSIATKDSWIESSIYRVWLGNSRKAR